MRDRLLPDRVYQGGKSRLYSLYVPQEVFRLNTRIAQRSLERKAVDLAVKRKHDSAAIGVLHLYVAAFAMNFLKPHALEGSQNLPARQERQLHTVNSTIS